MAAACDVIYLYYLLAAIFFFIANIFIFIYLFTFYCKYRRY